MKSCLLFIMTLLAPSIALADKQFVHVTKEQLSQYIEAVRLERIRETEAVRDAALAVSNDRAVEKMARREAEARAKQAEKALNVWKRAKLTPKDVFVDLWDLRVGETAYFNWRAYNQSVRVLQVIDSDEFLGEPPLISWDGFTRIRKSNNKNPRWFRGFNTTGLADGDRVYFNGIFAATDITQYTTVTGASRTTVVIEPAKTAP